MKTYIRRRRRIKMWYLIYNHSIDLLVYVQHIISLVTAQTKLLFHSVSLSVQTRILVTHGVSFLPYVDEIVVLVDGMVSEVGTYSSLRASRGAFSEFLDTYAKEQSNQTHSKSGNCTFSHCIIITIMVIIIITLLYGTFQNRVTKRFTKRVYG